MTTLRIFVRNKDHFVMDSNCYHNINIEKQDYNYSHDYDPAIEITITGKIRVIVETECESIYKFYGNGVDHYIIIEDNNDGQFKLVRIVDM